ncbi:MAG: response regulator [Pantoea piersonii]|jgi:preprotein translocase subunit YajC|uniref:Response regulator n=1 Tax=Pantoea piersonii TaxID=2364647 RepID=A0AAJ5UAG5_9GAMM|nr:MULTISPECIES: response regulator [Pantoea]MDU6432629.1 response regulator [Pantoea sp.]MBZ6385069.1 response regulator [Pantoea piersonii]MBZ6402140.1 response regulator [Pantoea piersonii]MBZ6409402.1 response regulator [Pantoea piersonii]MBZ6428671.1 response regulator [Pantoea piersonii]
MIYLILAIAGGVFIFSIIKLLQQRRQKRLAWGAARQR